MSERRKAFTYLYIPFYRAANKPLLLLFIIIIIRP